MTGAEREILSCRVAIAFWGDRWYERISKEGQPTGNFILSSNKNVVNASARWRVVCEKGFMPSAALFTDDKAGDPYEYADSIDRAMDLLLELQGAGFPVLIELTDTGGANVTIFHKSSGGKLASANADTLPIAVCLAILKVEEAKPEMMAKRVAEVKK